MVEGSTPKEWYDGYIRKGYSPKEARKMSGYHPQKDRPKWSPSKGAIRWQERKAKHEIELKLLDVMAKDPEMKYFLIICAGAGITAVGELLSPPAATQAQLKKKYSNPWEWVNPLNVANFYAQGGKLTEDTEGTALSSILKIGGMGIVGLASAILMLKAIFGEKGLEQFMKDIPGSSMLAGAL